MPQAYSLWRPHQLDGSSAKVHGLIKSPFLREQAAGALTADGKQRQLRLGVATKSQADLANRSIWLPSSALEGEYYSDIIFD